MKKIRKTVPDGNRSLTDKKCYLDPYEALAKAVVMQAVKDYLGIFGKMLRAQTDHEVWELQLKKEEVETFFYSRWYARLTDIDPDKLLAFLRDKAVRDEKNRLIGKQKKKKTVGIGNE